MNSIKDMVAGGKMVTFIHFRQNELWYTTECGFEFPVPIDDTGGATFKASEKALLLMRYIRKHIEYLNKAKAEESNES